MKAFLAKFKYWILLSIGGLVVLLLFLPRVFRLIKSPTTSAPLDDSDTHIHYPKIPRFIAEKIDKASEQATVIRAEAAAESAVAKEELAGIVAIPVARERRKRLAEFVSKV